MRALKTKRPPTKSSGGGSASLPVYKIWHQIDYLTHPEELDDSSNKEISSMGERLVA
jgi:hypothetical protein